ncbi:hypothetical protein EDB83DRAFT_2384230 [Lactarius deliciosus]|nr:hypothetical protein EDB83DRAFT_2384230 [Lactarius deliciosus]
MRALSALTLPAFDAELLSAAPGTLSHLTLLSDSLPYAFFDDFFSQRQPARVLPTSRCPISSACLLQSMTSHPPSLRALRRFLRRVTLRIASTPYNGLRTVALFGALGGSLKVLVLVLASDVDVRTRGRLLGALANTSAGLEVLTGSRFKRCASYAPPVDFSAWELERGEWVHLN